ncbi:hypothetical protein [Bradyrhizobium sp. CCBAU 11445]|uniref:hypothetical protein n=1 Tax=Bradyrhizobium sp. CCBAU 11445 TaxID=1630896 RepID=UPI0023054591|nr:hypothetical protein [Bradyrhizobium sp. CCBAU 11445]
MTVQRHLPSALEFPAGPDYFAPFHDDFDALQHRHIIQQDALRRHEVSVVPLLERSDIVKITDQLRSIPRARHDAIHWAIPTATIEPNSRALPTPVVGAKVDLNASLVSSTRAFSLIFGNTVELSGDAWT